MATQSKHLLVGGLVAIGFDSSGEYLMVVSHSGRGVFAVGTWERVARDERTLYPTEGAIEGVGPLAGMKVAVDQRDQLRERVVLRSPDGRYEVVGESDGITIKSLAG